MEPVLREATISTAASTIQTLPELAWRVESAYYANGTATAGSAVAGTTLTPVAGTTPADAQIRFDGSPTAPSATVKLKTAAVKRTALTVRFVPVGGLPL